MLWHCHRIHSPLLGCNIHCQVKCLDLTGSGCYHVLASLMLHRPLQFVDLTRLRTEKSHTAFHPSNKSQPGSELSSPEPREVMEGHIIEDIGAAADELEELTEKFIRAVGISAVESKNSRTYEALLSMDLQGPEKSPIIIRNQPITSCKILFDHDQRESNKPYLKLGFCRFGTGVGI